MRWPAPRSLRGRTVLFFGAGSFAVAAILAGSTAVLTRDYLMDQRLESVQRRASVDARVVAARLDTAGAQVDDILAGLNPFGGSAVLVRHHDRWYSSSLDVGPSAIPAQVSALAGDGRPALQVVQTGAGPTAVVAIPMPTVNGQLFELASLQELAGTLRALTVVLLLGTAIAAGAGVLLGLWFSHRLIDPLDRLAAASAEIAGGRLSLRLPATDDRDLEPLVGSFNRMVDALAARIETDARFASDVSHELRTPLTTLVAAVDLLRGRRDGLGAGQQIALDLVSTELDRFRRLLDDLIELARLDAATGTADSPEVDLRRLVAEVLRARGETAFLAAGVQCLVRADKRRLERIVVNLLDNARRHGGGVSGVEVSGREGQIRLAVDDAGPGVPLEERERVFARFATAGARRGSSGGTGLGLAIVRDTAVHLGGTAWCTSSPQGGARFVVRLPEARES